MPRPDTLRAMYRTLFRAWGRQHWWPAESPFEVILGAFLTQNTAWTNVEKALANLRRANALSLDPLRRMPLDRLAELVRPSGYFRQKAARLKGFVAFVDGQYGGSLELMFAQPAEKLRAELLALNGIGPETADSILLYAGNLPVFVVDAYTRRILDRHGVMPYDAPYESIRALCEAALGDPQFVAEVRALPAGDRPGSGACHSPSAMSTGERCAGAQVFNEMHGLFVGVAKKYCLKSKTLCVTCPLGPLLSRSQRVRLRRDGLLVEAPKTSSELKAKSSKLV